MDTPTAEYVRRRSRVEFGELGFPTPTGVDDPLDEEVADAVEYVQGVTWRKLDESLPAEFERRAARAVMMRTEQQVIQGTGDNVDAGADELTSSASAGAVSESRRAFSDSKAAREAFLVNRWPALNDLLWQLMTPEARAYWIAWCKGEQIIPPGGGFGVVEVAWDAAHREPYGDVTPGYVMPPSYGDVPIGEFDPYNA